MNDNGNDKNIFTNFQIKCEKHAMNGAMKY